MGRPAASVGAAAGRVSVWRRDSGARHGCTVAKRIPATCMVVVRGLRPLSVRCERRATAHYFMELNQLCLPGLLENLTGYESPDILSLFLPSGEPNARLSQAKMPTPGETAGACAYYGDGEARWLAYIEIGCRFTEGANR